ncbi:MAG: hypothetical protein GY760_29415 [Deltaproteobacteria bacterium]|nr:hypothetical protein [Deltaproteobacteria bacterium]
MILKKLFTRKKNRRNAMVEVIDNQFIDNDPVGIIDVFHDLVKKGYTDIQVKEMFSAVFEGELYKLNKKNIQFDREFYLESLKAIK